MAARKATGWTCRKRTCKFKNPPRTRKCQECGSARPAKRAPAHAAVLKELTYEDFIAINGGDFCWVCAKLPKSQRVNTKRRFDRDHSHTTGKARGLLCFKHNRFLKNWVTPELLRACAEYLDRNA